VLRHVVHEQHFAARGLHRTAFGTAEQLQPTETSSLAALRAVLGVRLTVWGFWGVAQ
jgi:hypothetical protein